jgi:hypothetical protein
LTFVHMLGWLSLLILCEHLLSKHLCFEVSIPSTTHRNKTTQKKTKFNYIINNKRKKKPKLIWNNLKC